MSASEQIKIWDYKDFAEMNMAANEGMIDSFQESFGALQLRYWRAKEDSFKGAQKVLFVVHGIGEHSGRYHELAQYLNLKGFHVCSLDLSGHGLSSSLQLKKRSHLRSFEQMSWDLTKALIQVIRLKFKDKNVEFSLFGHSLGALLSLKWLKDMQTRFKKELNDEGFRGMNSTFVSAPPLKLSLPVPAWKKLIANKLNKVIPHYKMSNEIALEMLSYDFVNQKAYQKDKWNHSRVSSHLFLSILKTAEEIKQSVASFSNCDLALAVGQDDRIVEPKAIEQFYQSLESPQKKFYLIRNAKHEIFNEVQRQMCYERLIEWII